jgi:hypothetical protein
MRLTGQVTTNGQRPEARAPWVRVDQPRKVISSFEVSIFFMAISYGISMGVKRVSPMLGIEW